MVDYKRIADNDPGGEAIPAFAILQAMTETRNRGVYKVTDKMIAAKLGIGNAVSFLDGLDQAVIDGVLPPVVVEWLKDGGVDINHIDTGMTLTALTSNNPPYVTLSAVNSILEMGDEIKTKFPGIKIGHLEDARVKYNGG